jgi:hypothetical protein
MKAAGTGGNISPVELDCSHPPLVHARGFRDPFSHVFRQVSPGIAVENEENVWYFHASKVAVNQDARQGPKGVFRGLF